MDSRGSREALNVLETIGATESGTGIASGAGTQGSGLPGKRHKRTFWEEGSECSVS